MELDKRITDEEYIFDCYSIDKAEQYLNKQGYFSDFIENFCDLDRCTYAELTKIHNYRILPYEKIEGAKSCYRFFLPEEFVNLIKPKEKKYRPYTLDEFQQNFTIGLVIRYRNKIDKLKKSLLYVGYERCKPEDISDTIIIIGDKHYTLDELFEHYEVYDRYGDWVPFGVEIG